MGARFGPWRRFAFEFYGRRGSGLFRLMMIRVIIKREKWVSGGHHIGRLFEVFTNARDLLQRVCLYSRTSMRRSNPSNARLNTLRVRFERFRVRFFLHRKRDFVSALNQEV